MISLMDKGVSLKTKEKLGVAGCAERPTCICWGLIIILGLCGAMGPGLGGPGEGPFPGPWLF